MANNPNTTIVNLTGEGDEQLKQPVKQSGQLTVPQIPSQQVPSNQPSSQPQRAQTEFVSYLRTGPLPTLPPLGLEQQEPLPLTAAQRKRYDSKRAKGGHSVLTFPWLPQPGARWDYPVNIPPLQDSISPRETMHLHQQMASESVVEYETRILTARRAIGFLDKDLVPPAEQIINSTLPEGWKREVSLRDQRLRYMRTRSRVHLGKIDPSHELYDPEYAARWYTNKEARSQRNLFVAEQVNNMVREWNSRNSDMPPTPLVEVDENTGDELYPLFEYATMPSAMKALVPPDNSSQPPLQISDPAGTLRSRQRMSKYRCEHCRFEKKFCTIIENGIIPCEACSFKKIPCDGSEPMPAALRDAEDWQEFIASASNAWVRPKSEYKRRSRARQQPAATNGGALPRSRGRSASPLREVEQRCDKCVQRGDECDMGRPCRSCVSRGESYLCDASVQGQAYGRELDSQGGFLRSEKTSPPMTRQEQSIQDSDNWNETLSSLASVAQYNASQQGTSQQGDLNQATSSTERNAISPYAEAGDVFVPIDDDDSINKIIQNSSLESNNTAEHQLPYRPHQEMQNAASTWGLQHQLERPVPEDPIVVESTMADVFDIPNDFDLNDFVGTMPTPSPTMNLDHFEDLPGNGIERAFVAKWITPNGAASLPHVDVLSGYPDQGAGEVLRERADTNCNEQKLHFLGLDFGPCWQKPASRCEYLQVGQPGFFWQGPANHVNPNPYHTCVGCHNEQDIEAQNWELEAKAGIKAFVCFGCSIELTAGAMTRFNACVCMDKLNKDWLCHDHRAKGYDQITRASGVVGEWLITAGGGRALCPRCYANYEDTTSQVYTCKSCRTYVQDQ